MNKYLFLFLFSFAFAYSGFAQLRVTDGNVVKIGPPPVASTGVSDNTAFQANFMVYGQTPLNIYRPGGRLSFGDFGSSTNGSLNVYVGEYFGDYKSTPSSADDTDQLELHGKSGIQFTTGGDNGSVAARLSRDGKLEVKSMFTVNMQLPSDIKLKTNVKNMSNGSLSKLKSLQAISYDYIDHKSEDKKMEDRIKTIKPQTAKEAAELTLMKKDLEIQKKQRLNHVGFSAQEVQKVLPNLVSQGEDGYLAVNYIGLIPSLVEAIKEQQAIIEQLQVEVEKLKRK